MHQCAADSYSHEYSTKKFTHRGEGVGSRVQLAMIAEVVLHRIILYVVAWGRVAVLHYHMI